MSVADELAKLAALREGGVLTQEEFDQQRAIVLDRAAATVAAAARARGPTSRRDQWHESIGLVLFVGMVIAFFSGAIVLAMAFLWRYVDQELSQRSILLAWPVAAVVLSVTFVPLALLAIRREGPLPLKAISAAAEMTPFGLAVGATVLAILILWTSIFRD